MNPSSNEFTNVDNLPAEKLVLTPTVTKAGIVQKVNALDAFFVEKFPLILYERPPVSSTVIGAVDAWKTKMEGYLEDLKLLLSLEHHNVTGWEESCANESQCNWMGQFYSQRVTLRKSCVTGWEKRFWSTILHNPQSVDMLVSFLQEANPPYMRPYESRKVQTLYEEIRKLVLIVFSRLITNKESKSQWLSKEYMKEIIYDKFIFTIPILWDICLVYGADNTQHVARLLDNIFSLQPKYLADLDAAIAFVQEAFKYIIMRVNKNYDNSEPPNLPESFKGFSEIRRPSNSCHKDEKLTFTILKDLVIHLVDTTMTLRIFIEVYPKCFEILKKRNFVLSIVQLYEHAVPHLYEKLDELGDETSVSHAEIQGFIDSGRAELIDIFREILAVPKDAIFSGEGSVEKHVEEYLSLMMDGLSERLFIQDYHACYPVNEDLELIKQAFPNIDSVKTDFILQAIYSNLEEPIPDRQPDNITNGHSEHYHVETTPKDHEIPDNIRQDSLISEVKDIFPDLGDGFILKCLNHYGFDSERVINSILEDNLDASLRSLDRKLPIIPEDPLDNHFLETGIERLNIFDGDKFDIMTRDDVDLSKIHTGKKKQQYKNIKDMLNDKSDVRQMTDIYSKYTMVCDDEAMYSDEYDDTYEGEPAVDDLGRPFVTPRALMKLQDYGDESDESPQPEPTEEEAGPSRNKLDFCVNPEEMRARREAAYRMKQGKGHRPPPPKNPDLTGKPKGQGQEKDVLHNRDKKEKNKSARANHNRRSGAQWKRTQGMMPS